MIYKVSYAILLTVIIMSMKKVLGCIKKADNDYNLIQENDRICVGVSGGKDSMLLLYALHLYQKTCVRMKTKNFEVIGIHIQMGFPDMDFQPAIDFFKEKEIPFYEYDSKIYEILKIQANEDGSLKCSLCSKFKKATVIDAAKKEGCNKVAFAHHGDDAIETLLMNAIYGGRLATFRPKMYLTNTEMNFIRPFVYAYESDITNAINEAHVPIIKSTCPMDGHTKRQEAKELLESLYSKYPSAKENFLLALHNSDKVDLWKHEDND